MSWPQRVDPHDWREERRPHPAARRKVHADRPHGFHFHELAPMAAIILTFASLTAVSTGYVTAFARLTAEGTQAMRLDRDITQLKNQNSGLQSEVARLQRRDRIEREARRLGLVPLEPSTTRRVALPGGDLATETTPITDPAANR